MEATPLPHHQPAWCMPRRPPGERGRQRQVCSPEPGSPPGKPALQLTKWVPTWTTTWAPVRDADSQAPSQPRPPPEPPEGSVSTSSAGDSATLWCESQGLALISFAFRGSRRNTPCYPGARTMQGRCHRPEARATGLSRHSQSRDPGALGWSAPGADSPT